MTNKEQIGTATSTRLRAKAVALGFLLAVFAAVGSLAVPAQAAPMTFTVDSTADGNLMACVEATADDCTLRGAINASNANAGADTIEFEIPGAGVKTITPATNLPVITEAVTINGYSQTGASPNTKTLADGNDAVLLIELDETSMGGSLTINADGTTVRGLVINGGNTDKIRLNASSVIIAGNFIGVDPTGAAAKSGASGGYGIRQVDSDTIDNDNNTIGGTTPAARNVISGAAQGGIIIEDGDGTVIRGNYIGPNAAGTAALTTSGEGILVLKGSIFGAAVTNTTIAGNLISGNKNGGVTMGSGGQIQGNLIGTQRDGTSALGNGSGVFLTGTDVVAVGGAVLAGEGNTIAFNTNVGVAVQTGGNSKEILGNSIHSNGLLGIGLTGAASSTPFPNDPGDAAFTGVGNRGQNYPVITSAAVSGGNATVSGTLNSIANTDFRIEFFANTACDASGNGEGRTFIGSTDVTTGASGDASFGPLTFNNVPAGQSVITSTATNKVTNDTSEFSQCLTATGGDDNAAPVANDDPTTPGDPDYATNEGDPLMVSAADGVLANDTDADEDTLTVASPRPTSGPSNGTLTLNADGSFTYMPSANFNGTDSFTYEVCDDADSPLCDTATAAITVNPVNDAPACSNGVDDDEDGQADFPDDPGCESDDDDSESLDPPTSECDITGTENDEVLRGTNGDDVICALAGNDTVYGLDGDDTVLGGDGQDSIYAGPGKDGVLGGSGSDIIRGFAGNDDLDGGEGGTGRDRIFAGAGKDELDVKNGVVKDLANGGADGDRCAVDRGDHVRNCE